MRVLHLSLLSLVLIFVGQVTSQSEQSTAPMQPKILAWLTENQKKDLGKLFGDYADSFPCGKHGNFEGAANLLQSNLRQDSFTPQQVAELSHMAVGIQNAQIQIMAAKSKLSQEAIAQRCKDVVERAFGPNGNLIRGLLLASDNSKP